MTQGPNDEREPKIGETTFPPVFYLDDPNALAKLAEVRRGAEQPFVDNTGKLPQGNIARHRTSPDIAVGETVDGPDKLLRRIIQFTRDVREKRKRRKQVR